MTETNAERAIGRLEGKLDALATIVEDENKKSDARGARIYKELEQIRLDAADSRRDIADLKKRIAADEPAISDIKRWKERLIGMQLLMAFLTAIAGGAVVAFWRWISAKVGLSL